MIVAIVYDNRFSFEDSKLLLDPEGGWGGTWVNFWSVCVAGLSQPLCSLRIAKVDITIPDLHNNVLQVKESQIQYPLPWQIQDKRHIILV